MQKLFNLICFPYAGAGASIFNSWEKVSNDFNLIAVQLPGREKKFTEKPFTDAKTAINCLIPEILNDIDKNIPVVVFGHCMGALLAYECTKQLLERDDIKITHLIASGSPSPLNKKTEAPKYSSDDEFIHNIETITGYKHPALEIPAMRSLILPTLKADAEMNNSYRPSEQKPLDIPVTTIRGTDDDLASVALVEMWNETTTLDVVHKELPGGHLYLLDNAENILNIIHESAYE